MTKPSPRKVVATRVPEHVKDALAAMAAAAGGDASVSSIAADLLAAAVAAHPEPEGAPHRWTSTHRGNVCAVCAQAETGAARWCPGSRTRPPK